MMLNALGEENSHLCDFVVVVVVFKMRQCYLFTRIFIQKFH